MPWMLLLACSARIACFPRSLGTGEKIGRDGYGMVYRFEPFELDGEGYSLTRGGRRIPVEPLVFDLLIFLVQNRWRVTSRSEMLDTLWSGKVVSDACLSNAVNSARKALGDSAVSPLFIRTIRGRGYRFIAEVLEIPTSLSEC